VTVFVLMLDNDDDDDDVICVDAGEFGCGGRQRTPHGRRFFVVLTVAWLLWQRCLPFFSNTVAAACFVVVVFFVVVVARPLLMAAFCQRSLVNNGAI